MIATIISAEFLALAYWKDSYYFWIPLAFLTNWGKWLTFFTFCLAQFVYPREGEISQTRVYSPFKLWKWFSIMFAVTLTLEFLITLYYWAVLFPNLDREVNSSAILDHSIPFIVLVVDYAFVNQIPIKGRYVVGMFIVGGLYLVLMVGATLSRGKPLYPGMDFQSPIGVILPLGLLLITLLFFWILICINKCKLRKLNGRVKNIS